MKKFILILYLLLIAPVFVIAENSVQGEIESMINAKINTGEYLYNEENLLLKYKADLSDSLTGYASLDFRYLNFSSASKTSDLNNIEKIEPIEIWFKEAYIDYYGFLFDRLDLRIGKQRIAWGTADKINPTDNLNPDDLTYIFDFGEKIPTLAAKAVFYLSDDFSIQGVWLPYFVPVKFDDNIFNYAVLLDENLKNNIIKIFSEFGITPAVSISDNNMVLPEPKTKNAMYAFKFAGKVFDFDFSLSYFNGYDDVPIMTSLNVDGSSVLSGRASADYEMSYSKLQVVGLDTAGEIFSIGVWAEAACFIPKEVQTITTLQLPAILGGTTKITNISLDKEPYFKYTIGFDYTFKTGIYINSQFAHGFFTERGYHYEKPQDYIVARIEDKFFDDKLKVGLSGSIELKDLNSSKSFSEVRKNSGNLWGTDITYYHDDNTELSIGFVVIQGNEETFFGKLQAADQIYLKAKLYF